MAENTTTAAPVSIGSLLTPTKTLTMSYPDIEGWEVELTYLSREELMKVRNRCLKQKFNKKTRAFEEVLDDDLFLTNYVSEVIKGWKGLKYKHLAELVLVDLGNTEPEKECPYSQENAEVLMKNSPNFDTWVTECVGELENFTSDK